MKTAMVFMPEMLSLHRAEAEIDALRLGLRDHFAAAALPIACQAREEHGGTMEHVAKAAFAIADIMVEERNVDLDVRKQADLRAIATAALKDLTMTEGATVVDSPLATEKFDPFTIHHRSLPHLRKALDKATATLRKRTEP